MTSVVLISIIVAILTLWASINRRPVLIVDHRERDNNSSGCLTLLFSMLLVLSITYFFLNRNKSLIISNNGISISGDIDNMIDTCNLTGDYHDEKNILPIKCYIYDQNDSSYIKLFYSNNNDLIFRSDTVIRKNKFYYTAKLNNKSIYGNISLIDDCKSIEIKVCQDSFLEQSLMVLRLINIKSN